MTIVCLSAQFSDIRPFSWDTRRWCIIESTSKTFIQRRYNGVCQLVSYYIDA